MTANTVDFEVLRREFPILETRANGRPLAYLDNAATAQKPRAVLSALDQYWTGANANVHRGVHHLSQLATRLYDDAREKTRRLLGAESTDEVIFTKGCTEGINLVATGLPLREGDAILLTEMEHHSNIVPWQMAAARTGAKVAPIPITDRGEVDLDAYARLLRDNRVAMVGMVHVSNALGTINPVAEMIRMAHEAGALALVDGAQAGPHLRLDVRALGADFYTLSCHKIYAPTGVGVLYGKRERLEALPPYQGGGDMIRSVSFEATTYAGLPAKFEAGTPNVAGVIGLGASIDFLTGLGDAGGADPLAGAFAAIQARERELAERARQGLSEIGGLRITGEAPERAGIVAFTLENAHPHDIGTILDGEGVAIRAGHHCCMPLMRRLGVPATARASFAFYNTREEVDRLVAGVRKVKELFG